MHFGEKKALVSYLCRASNEGVRLEIIPGSFIQLENLASVARSTMEKCRCWLKLDSSSQLILRIKKTIIKLTCIFLSMAHFSVKETGSEGNSKK